MSMISYPTHAPIFCHIPASQLAQWHQQQQQRQQQQQQQPTPPPEQAGFYPAAGYCTNQVSPPQHQTQLIPARPYDLGYESDSKEPQQQFQQQQHLQHLQRFHYQPPSQVPPLRQQPLLHRASAVLAIEARQSPGSSCCDSGRSESPADAQLAEVTSDLEGVSLGNHQCVDMALSQTMEVVWHREFDKLFSRFDGDRWQLVPVFDQPDTCDTGIAKIQWRYFKDQAKVRFICTSCQKAWTSMGGQVVFWIFRDPMRRAGFVLFKLYGQKCTDCNPDYYEHAIWYQEEVEKVVENIFQHVGHVYYGFQQQRRRVERRAGQPRKEHSSATCQACQENVCRMGQVLRKKMRCSEPA